jgi:hypothetical protein
MMANANEKPKRGVSGPNDVVHAVAGGNTVARELLGQAGMAATNSEGRPRKTVYELPGRLCRQPGDRVSHSRAAESLDVARMARRTGLRR